MSSAMQNKLCACIHHAWKTRTSCHACAGCDNNGPLEAKHWRGYRDELLDIEQKGKTRDPRPF